MLEIKGLNFRHKYSRADILKGIDFKVNTGEIAAVSDISFQIKRGEIFGLLGPNGAGKTTIIKMITTLTMPDSGLCTVDDFNTLGNPFEIKKRIGVVPQVNNLDKELTAYENLLIYGMLHSVKNIESKIRYALESVDLLVS